MTALPCLAYLIVSNCCFFSMVQENVKHVFIECAAVNIIWSSILIWANLQDVIPTLALILESGGVRQG